MPKEISITPMDKYFHEIFPTPFWHFKAVNDREERAKIKECYRWALEVEKNIEGVQLSNQGGYQSKDSKSFANIPHFDYLIRHLDFLPQFNFNTWWININRKGHWNNVHNHPNTDLTVIWYFTDNYNSLQLHHPNNLGYSRHSLNQSFLENRPIIKKEGVLLNYPFDDNRFKVNSHMWDCKEGDILIFPSDLPYSNFSHKLRNPQISFSMNINMIH